MEKVCVICLCYNHENYVQEAMLSVIKQDYPLVEMIVVDDASTDNSLWQIEQFKLENPKFPLRTIFLAENLGNTKAFNKALVLTDATYIIDLAADDILLPTRVSEGVKNLELHKNVAINFSNAELIEADGIHLSYHYPLGEYGRSLVHVPEGDVFEQVLERYFICPPSMMYRASMLKAVGGYDENLAYEDFDIMLKLSRKHLFSYSDKVLVQKRDLPTSMSKKQYKLQSNQLKSTHSILEGTLAHLKSRNERRAFRKRVLYELKQSMLHKRLVFCFKFIILYIRSYQPK